MSVIDLNLSNIKETIEKNEMVFIDFWAPWCGPCQRFGPVFEGIAAKNPDLKFAKINTDDQAELAGQFGVMSIPTLGIFKDKELIFLQPGALPEEVLEEIIQKVRDVNMDEVRAQVAADNATATVGDEES
ncbi:MAG: thioredoxin [Bdellovibrionaceae bacterium]|nr:thioredoxin [Pseudobdellovibrionaceae bacterium]MBX3033141.1 thioredoxin [Pseudobdellovibrionaceae bacterium]